MKKLKIHERKAKSKICNITRVALGVKLAARKKVPSSINYVHDSFAERDGHGTDC